jgi:hypothetical protein
MRRKRGTRLIHCKEEGMKVGRKGLIKKRKGEGRSGKNVRRKEVTGGRKEDEMPGVWWGLAYDGGGHM